MAIRNLVEEPVEVVRAHADTHLDSGWIPSHLFTPVAKPSPLTRAGRAIRGNGMPSVDMRHQAHIVPLATQIRFSGRFSTAVAQRLKAGMAGEGCAGSSSPTVRTVSSPPGCL
ncbi:MAG TPA: hypothetical protein VLB85_02435 [Acidimicrobiia bacterium]|nr:hypothetical protein [Acidimicrobiia bacterium]